MGMNRKLKLTMIRSLELVFGSVVCFSQFGKRMSRPVLAAYGTHSYDTGPCFVYWGMSEDL